MVQEEAQRSRFHADVGCRLLDSVFIFIEKSPEEGRRLRRALAQDLRRCGQLCAVIDGDPAQLFEQKPPRLRIEAHLLDLDQREVALALDPHHLREQPERLDANSGPGLFLCGEQIAVEPDHLRVYRPGRQNAGRRPSHEFGPVFNHYAHILAVSCAAIPSIKKKGGA